MFRLVVTVFTFGALLLAPRAASALEVDSTATCTELTEGLSARIANAPVQGALPLEDAGSSVPWCASPDDPRCSPMDGGPLPPQTGAQPKLVLGAEARGADRFSTMLAAWPLTAAEGDLRSGAHLRLDRPPRAHRWNA